MLFSDLEDDDESERQNSGQGRKESGKSLNDSDNSVPKMSKSMRKKSVMSYAI